MSLEYKYVYPSTDKYRMNIGKMRMEELKMGRRIRRIDGKKRKV
jgi:hypothetical protein